MKSQHLRAVNGNSQTPHNVKARLQSANNYVGGRSKISTLYPNDKGAQTLRAKNHNRVNQKMNPKQNTYAFGGFFSPGKTMPEQSHHKRDRSQANLKQVNIMESDYGPTLAESIDQELN